MFIDRLALIILLGCVLLTPSLIDWATSEANTWYRPYLLGLAAIGLNYWLLKRLT